MRKFELPQVGKIGLPLTDGSLLQESFGYDALNRLVTSQVSGQTQKTYGYDQTGNLIGKSDVGSYGYPASGAGSVRPHAVANISGTVTVQGSSSFSYDANGNVTSGANRSMTWTSFDMPATITRTLAGSSGASINVAL